VDNKQPTPGEITIMVAGAVMLIASFLDFVSQGSFGRSAWGGGFFPIATLMVIYGVIMALQIALTKFANVHLPARFAGFTWEQIHLVLGIFTVLMAIAWLVTDIGPDKAIGFWLIFLASIALVVGAVLLQRERNTGALR
jgi:hypothetical protein